MGGYGQDAHDCFTHISFFHGRFRLRLLLRSLRRGRGGETKASSGERWERPKAWRDAEPLSEGNEVSSSVGEGMLKPLALEAYDRPFAAAVRCGDRAGEVGGATRQASSWLMQSAETQADSG